MGDRTFIHTHLVFNEMWEYFIKLESEWLHYATVIRSGWTVFSGGENDFNGIKIIYFLCICMWNSNNL